LALDIRTNRVDRTSIPWACVSPCLWTLSQPDANAPLLGVVDYIIDMF
jgi:hypothetical protein